MADHNSMVVLCLGLLAAAVVYGFYRRTRERSLLAWGHSLSLLTASAAMNVLYVASGLRLALILSDTLLFVAAGSLFGIAWQTADSSRFRIWHAVTSFLVLVWIAALVLAPQLAMEWVSPLFAISLGFCSSAVLFGRAAANRAPGAIHLSLACLFLAASAIAGSAAFVRGNTTVSLAAAVCGLLLLSVGAISRASEGQRLRTEDHLLALSTLVLSHDPGESAGSMLERVLDRMLQICGVTDGILWITESEYHPAVQIMRGFSADFVEQWEKRGGQRKAAAVIDKLGGLLILGDLGRAAEAGRLEADGDYRDFRAMLAQAGAQSVFSMALRTKSAVRGYLILPDARKSPFSLTALRLLATSGTQLALAVENFLMFAQEQRRHGRLSFLNRVARIAISNLNSDQMLGEIASEMERNLEYDHISIGVLDYQTKRIELKAVGRRQSESEVYVPLESGIVGRVARTGQMILRNHIAPEAQPETLLRDARSVLCLPIIHAQQTLGVLNVERVSEAGFPPDDVILLRTLADQLAAALHNALVFRQVREQAITDSLTGMKTRRYFDEALTAEWTRSLRSRRPFALILMDLDRFKPINDRFGHVEGDLVLARIGKILEQRCRRSNVVARYGGDEFIVLMAEAGTEQALILAERLRAWVAEDPALSERGLTASFGLAAYPLHGDTADEMIKAADVGLYLAKARGGNNVAISECLSGDVSDSRTRQLLDEIRSLAANLSTGPQVLEALVQRVERDYPALDGDPVEIDHAITEALISLSDAIGRRLYGPLAYTRSLGFHAMRLGALLGLPSREQELLRTAGSLHDLGFLALADSEFSGQPAENVEAGARLLHAARVNPEVIRTVQRHHDALDDREHSVPLTARILAVVDVYDAEVGQTPGPGSTARAIHKIQRLAGTRLDLVVVNAFVSLVGARAEAASD